LGTIIPASFPCASLSWLFSCAGLIHLLACCTPRRIARGCRLPRACRVRTTVRSPCGGRNGSPEHGLSVLRGRLPVAEPRSPAVTPDLAFPRPVVYLNKSQSSA